MWFKLAEANGLSGDTPLTEGTTLYVPSGVQRNTFNASTFKPFNHDRWIERDPDFKIFVTPPLLSSLNCWRPETV